MSSSIPAEARGKARRWIAGLPAVGTLKRAFDATDKARLVDDLARKTSKAGRERAVAAAVRAFRPAFGAPWFCRVERPPLLVWRVIGRVEGALIPIDDAVFDPAAAEHPAAVVIVAAFDAHQEAAIFKSSQLEVSLHAVGRYHERIDGDLDGAILALLENLQCLPRAGPGADEEALCAVVERRKEQGRSDVPLIDGGLAWIADFMSAWQLSNEDGRPTHANKTASVFIRSVLRSDMLSDAQLARSFRFAAPGFD